MERLSVNVTVENLAPCKKLVRVEVDVQKVDEAFDSVTKDVQRHAVFPGFRPGKAPRDMVVRKYEKDIADEVKKKLISDSYKTAVKEQNLDVLGYPDIEEIQFGRGKVLQFAATVETAPEFELPEYKGLVAKRETRTVTDEDMTRAVDKLREQRTDYKTADRPAQTGDIAVVNYTGTSEGKSLTEIAPTAKGLTTQTNFWIDIGSQSFIPGFGEQLVGAKAGDKRTVTVDFPAEFVSKELAGKKGVYEVEVTEVKEKTLPVLDDEFAKSYGAENVEKFREGVRHDLENELKYQTNKNIRNQLIGAIMSRVNFDLPESAVAQETRNVVYDLVRQYQKSGVDRDAIEQHKEEIYSNAAQGAKGRVKFLFLLEKIAEKEKITVTNEELSLHVAKLAAMYNVPAEKFVKDLQQRNGLPGVHQEALQEKVLAFVQEHAQIVDVPPGSLSQAEPQPQPANPA